MATWQYTVATIRKRTFGWKWEPSELQSFDLIEGLNFLGGHGFELIAVVPEIADGEAVSCEYTFKRPLGS
jgi:hypothetical protein